MDQAPGNRTERIHLYKIDTGLWEILTSLWETLPVCRRSLPISEYFQFRFHHPTMRWIVTHTTLKEIHTGLRKSMPICERLLLVGGMFPQCLSSFTIMDCRVELKLLGRVNNISKINKL